MSIRLTINGLAVQAEAGQHIIEVCDALGIEVPRLCYRPGMRPDGNCRACVVEVAGERTLTASCCRQVADEMQVSTDNARVHAAQNMVLELLQADLSADSELDGWSARRNILVRDALVALRPMRVDADLSHSALVFDPNACIQCTRCVRACREEQVNDVLGYAFRGHHSQIVFDAHQTIADSTCVACGECVQACPTGALVEQTVRHAKGHVTPPVQVDSVCPFCGVGCQLTYQVSNNKIITVQGKNGPANDGRLCVKGRFGFDYVHHTDRLTQPLMRKAGVPKQPGQDKANRHWSEEFEPVSWEQALDAAAGGFNRLMQRYPVAQGYKVLAGFGSAKGSNEEAYLFQKLVRTGFGSNNVDHCTRLCHASSVSALLEGIGSGAVSNPIKDVEHSDVIVVIGANPTSNHPVAATWIKNAVKRGARLILIDPRATDLATYAWRTLQFMPDTDVLLLNAILHVIVKEGLINQTFIEQRVTGYEHFQDHLQAYSPDAVAAACGVDAHIICEVARAYATSKASMIVWGMGVSQHIHGTDNVRCLIAMAGLTGQIGRPGTGLHPLRGQNNVQGASDAGLIPMMFPNYQRVDNPDHHRWFEQFWDVALDASPGYTVTEILKKIMASDEDPHTIRGMWIMGENPAMSDPDVDHARLALASLEHLVVQDIFMTETAWLADIVLPASAWPEKTGTVTNTDRLVQLGQRALTPPGQARQDLWIIQQIAQRIGLSWAYEGPESGVGAVFEEMRQAMHEAIGGITWSHLVQQHAQVYPCVKEGDEGDAVVFGDHFPMPDGKLHLKPVEFIHADELPDVEYPMTLITGRLLEHWHTGSMTRRSLVLNAVEPQATVAMNGRDMRAQGLQAGDEVIVQSRRGQVKVRLREDDSIHPGTVFMPFAFHEAPANRLTNPALDPFGKIPEFKFCAVKVNPSLQ